jgi:hypothetical protein
MSPLKIKADWGWSLRRVMEMYRTLLANDVTFHTHTSSSTGNSKASLKVGFGKNEMR